MEASLAVDSCLDVVKASVLCNNPSHQQTYQYISDNFDEIVQRDNFKQLSKDKLMSLFTNLNRNTVQEMSLYTAVTDWVKHDQNREAEFSSLFLTLNLKKFPSEFVANTIAQEPLVKNSKECLNAVLLCLANNVGDKIAGYKPSKILCIGGDQSKTVSEVFSVTADSLNTYPDLPCNLSGHCVLKADNLIYCLGGAIDGNWKEKTSNQVYRLNFKAPISSWEEVARMTEKRSDFGAAIYNGCLVVAGGYNDYAQISSTEL